MTEIIKTVLTVLGTLGGGWLVYAGQKFIRRSSDQANKDERDSAWNAAYRAGAERHMHWDWNVLSVVRQLQDVVHALEDKLEMTRTVFDRIEDPPPLFPERDRPKPPEK